ncbi:hypothetical protein [Methylobacterium nodulans]|uniref:Uncharacterized protein n=1 Tax=Methylobacterium nodulans (strain LMG 21967 / CNCM I-2342 / ORS 2060) TaxID=460265 RepID=B8IFF4_METNO|nr:hypothetical protein [Methylobacterium nodulans]ACL57689.1 conserved hypothetical protein [Methylobacterium nodulans ORS 2060]
MRLTTLSLPLLLALSIPAAAQTAPMGNPFGPGGTVGLPSGAGAAPRPAPAPTAKPVQDPAPAPSQKPARAAPSGTIFPPAVSPKYANEPTGMARQKTCLGQYNANKAAGGSGNGGMPWIVKGGGYWSECNKRLKG